MLVPARLLLGFSFMLVACGPIRDPFPDVPASDTGPRVDVSDTGMDAADAGPTEGGSDGRTDASADGLDSGPCEDMACDTACVSMGFLLGVCRAGRCDCRGPGMDGGPDSPTRDAPMFETRVRFCTSNTDCPPSTFCNGPGCGGGDGGVSFCAPRGETDAATCGPEGPPSCGCDGTLYPNTCARLSAGVRLNPAGTCGRVDAGPRDAMMSGG